MVARWGKGVEEEGEEEEEAGVGFKKPSEHWLEGSHRQPPALLCPKRAIEGKVCNWQKRNK